MPMHLNVILHFIVTTGGISTCTACLDLEYTCIFIGSCICFQHSMVYFFHHYELPAILHQARIQHILAQSQQQQQQQQQGQQPAADQQPMQNGGPAAAAEGAAATNAESQTPVSPEGSTQPAMSTTAEPLPASPSPVIAEVLSTATGVEGVLESSDAQTTLESVSEPSSVGTQGAPQLSTPILESGTEQLTPLLQSPATANTDPSPSQSPSVSGTGREGNDTCEESIKSVPSEDSSCHISNVNSIINTVSLEETSRDCKDNDSTDIPVAEQEPSGCDSTLQQTIISRTSGSGDLTAVSAEDSINSSSDINEQEGHV